MKWCRFHEPVSLILRLRRMSYRATCIDLLCVPAHNPELVAAFAPRPAPFVKACVLSTTKYDNQAFGVVSRCTCVRG